MDVTRTRPGGSGTRNRGSGAKSPHAHTTINGHSTARESAEVARRERERIAKCKEIARMLTDTIDGAPNHSQADARDKAVHSCIVGDPATAKPPKPGKPAAVAPAPDPELLARRAVLGLNLPEPTPIVEPSPNLNKWHTLAIGQPLWLRTRDNATAMTRTMTVEGYPVRLTATRRPISFAMGDGHTVTCTRTTPWNPHVDPDADSPTCGYRYATLPKGSHSYTVTATTPWTITWSVLGKSGTTTLTKSDATTIPIHEILTVLVPNRGRAR
ncbi:hypothetical protein [Cutibacterium granulosum]|uniref:hypothetical protein n=1 Tax=Cutibacterium granulosum TaxID=33011 RepID=UPI002572FF38|nr:hypothetical protein [Cutibacterium granulosum]MDU1523304.1 hypothetical protein [Cutibacterium granulosum]MDU7728079.1 hypothetical protein [Cutibacterium granulosum]BDQ39981.1 hypothetical protein TPCG7_06300 [Cutibacterium granulosum]